MRLDLAFRIIVIYLISVILLTNVTGAARADVISLNAIDAGWYGDSGLHIPGNKNYNYFVGYSSTPPVFGHHNFFVFGLSDIIPGSITSGELRLFNPLGGYVSPDPTETYTLFDVSTPISFLVAGGNGLTSVYNDLDSGKIYGSSIVSPADNGRLITTPLNAAALADLNSVRDLIAIGGALTTLHPDKLNDEAVFAFSDASAFPPRLVLVASSAVPVPEPSTLGLFGVGLLGLLTCARRQWKPDRILGFI